MSDGRGDNEEVQLRRKNRQALIDRLNASEERLREVEGRRREPDRLSEEELAHEIEMERNRSRRSFGQAFSLGLLWIPSGRIRKP